MLAAYEEHRKDSLNTFPPTYGSHIDVCWPHSRGAGTTVDRDKVDIGTHGRVARYRMSIPTKGSKEIAASALAVLTQKLGEGTTIDTERGQEHHYANAEAELKVKAVVAKESVHLTFSEYLPLEKLLGGAGPGLGLEPEGVFGTYEDIAKADPEHFEPSGVLASLVYPGTEFASGLTEVRLTKMSKAKKVSSYRVVLHYGQNPALETKILGLLEAKFGPARESKREASKGEYLDFGGKGQRKISVWKVSDQFQITVTP